MARCCASAIFVGYYKCDDYGGYNKRTLRLVRNRLKIKSTVTNARLFLDIQKEFGSFYDYTLSSLGSGADKKETGVFPDNLLISLDKCGTS